MDPETPADPDLAARYRECIKLRGENIPLQHITGEQNFMGFSFKVNRDVLIPRQDTEVLVETVLDHIPRDGSVLDMCTGSGCILLSYRGHGVLRLLRRSGSLRESLGGGRGK